MSIISCLVIFVHVLSTGFDIYVSLNLTVIVFSISFLFICWYKDTTKIPYMQIFLIKISYIFLNLDYIIFWSQPQLYIIVKTTKSWFVAYKKRSEDNNLHFSSWCLFFHQETKKQTKVMKNIPAQFPCCTDGRIPQFPDLIVSPILPFRVFLDVQNYTSCNSFLFPFFLSLWNLSLHSAAKNARLYCFFMNSVLHTGHMHVSPVFLSLLSR